MGYKSFHGSMISVGAVATMLVATPAIAQERRYDVPAQPAEKAIPLFARQAGVPVLARGSDVKGKRTNAVEGNYPLDEALELLLRGTGLKPQRQRSGAITIVSATASSTAPVGNGVLVGSVRDHKTGGALKGALVEVVGTGEKTSTGDLGDFRFSRLPVGDVSLRISYLGFPEQVETVSVVGGLTNRAEIYLGSGVTTEIVVIAGQTSARAQALNQERTAENSTTVISSDLLGQFNGTTISDAMRRAPGISFQQNDLTGDGTNVIVRGLEPDYNQIRLNGVALVDGTGLGRSASLSTILADSVAEIKISKTLLPNQDSAGTGGLIEIETKSPLEHPRRYANLSVEGLKRGKGYGEDYLLSGTLSARFGADDRFGLSLSVQHRNQQNTSLNYTTGDVIPGPYLPLGPEGELIQRIYLDPRLQFPFEAGADGLYTASVNNSFNDVKAKSLTGTVSAEWQVSPATNIKIDYVRAQTNSETMQRNYSLSGSAGYFSARPVPALNGDTRYVITSDPQINSNLFLRYTPEVRETTDNLSLRGTTHVGRTSIDFRAGYVSARSYTAATYTSNFTMNFLSVTPDILAPGAIDPVTGAVTTYFGRRIGDAYPLPLLTEAGFAAIAPSNSRFLQASALYDGRARTRGLNGGLDIKREFDSDVLKYLAVGGEYKRTRVSTSGGGADFYSAVFGPGPDFTRASATEMGLEFGPVRYSQISGSPNALLIPTVGSTRAFFEDLDSSVTAGQATVERYGNDPIADSAFTRESDIALYAQSRLEFGNLEVIGGARMSRVTVDANFINSNTYIDRDGNFDFEYSQNSRVLTAAKATQTDWLPRVSANWRPRENIVFRGAYYATVARPQIALLSRSQFIFLNLMPNADPVTGTQPYLEINQGNPALKPARSDNFDVGAEMYSRSVGVLKANFFYKSIANGLEQERSGNLNSLDGIDLPDDPPFQNLPSNLYVQIVRPVNNPYRSEIWGIELAAERRLEFLPGPLAGLGIYANYTFTHSRSRRPMSWFTKPVFDGDGNIVGTEEVNYVETLSFYQSPKHSGTLGLTYSKYGFDASLYYSFQGRRKNNAGQFGVVPYAAAVNSLDFRGEYRFDFAGADARLWLEGRNLLKGSSDANTRSYFDAGGDVPRAYNAAYFLGGRSASLGLSVSF